MQETDFWQDVSTASVYIQTNMKILKIVQRMDIKGLWESEKNQSYYQRFKEFNQFSTYAEKVKGDLIRVQILIQVK